MNYTSRRDEGIMGINDKGALTSSEDALPSPVSENSQFNATLTISRGRQQANANPLYPYGHHGIRCPCWGD
ncbi:hypothetical protein Bpfe_029839 [Biomphalaria pfeifferi]|uniref:Uncharacterized protein n=1 Tax=Biomphalaria pfeifferi TaxID=112525 RepID=A0AAD8EVI2_BIOPF|nr:hypothetical protein Bpfe_029839 [Biomphalaria pfeifferi]